MSFEWNEDFATGTAEIDNQHKEIFNLFNTLLEAMDEGKGKKEIDRIVKFLEQYIKTHFHNEEKFMLERAYDGYLRQRAEHTQFIKCFYRLKIELIRCGTTLHLVVQTAQQLGNWLADHIKIEDKRMAAVLRKNSG
jgi:hemerythrin